jgi:mortality factor 4-like protein 1
MSDVLLSILVDDWEYVTKNLQVAVLPSAYPINQIMDDYEEFARGARGGEGDIDAILEEVVGGMREYINKLLGRTLLYRYERVQYADLLDRMKDPDDKLFEAKLSDIYGCEHLLRLWGKHLVLFF